MIDRTVRMNLLFDFYGQLLTERQRTLFSLYFHDDLSLGEIAEQFQVSRQAVYDILKRSQRALEEFEAKLGLVGRYLATQRALRALGPAWDELVSRIEALPVPDPGRAELLASIGQLRQRVEALLSESWGAGEEEGWAAAGPGDGTAAFGVDAGGADRADAPGPPGGRGADGTKRG